MTLAGSVVELATRIGQEIRAVRAELAAAAAGKADSGHTHAAPAPRTATVSTATYNADGGAPGDLHLTITHAAPTITPTGTPNGRTVVIDMLASGGACTPAIAAAVKLTEGVTSQSLAIPSGQVGRAVLRYSALGGLGWSLDSLYLVG